MGGSGRVPTAVDLFSGAGGLTLGLKKAGFRVVAGVEISSEIVETYKANHPEVAVIAKDVRQVTGTSILKAAGVKKVDLVAGCPPCQGFSRLTDKWHRDDPRNDLVLEMARIVEELNPSVVMMENVPGLAKRGRSKLDAFVKKVESLGYKVKHEVLQLANYGIPQSRRRFVLLAGKGFEIPLPSPTHVRPQAAGRLKPWITVADVVKGMGRPITMRRAMNAGGPEKYDWHVVRDLKDVTKQRLKALKAGKSRVGLPKSLRPDCHKDSDDGFENVYGRMSWKQVPPTVTTGCTTPCMGRYGHPSQLRTISIREAAMFQTFPKSYRFRTKHMAMACELVGNALPPKFARVVGKACYEAMIHRQVT